jgi:carboxypeptidase Q
VLSLPNSRVWLVGLLLLTVVHPSGATAEAPRVASVHSSLGTTSVAPADTGLPAPANRIQSETAYRIIAAALADDFAYEILGELCDTIGPRLCGSPPMEAAAAWAVAVMEQAGFTAAWTESFPVSHWQRGEEWAEVTQPVPFKLDLLGLGRSVGTPAQGIEAEVMAVRDFAELAGRASEAAGKIVLYHPPWQGYGKTVRYRRDGAIRAAAHGAVACLIRSVTKDNSSTPHTGVMAYADTVPRIPAAALTVEDAGRLYRLAKRGLRPRVKLFMSARTDTAAFSSNVVGDIRGRERPDEIVLVSGHLDSWDTGTGAHDDGAGAIVALAAARQLKMLGLIPRRTIRVVLYGCEEFGTVAGDAYRDAHRDEVDQHVAAIEADSGGFRPAGFSVRADSSLVNRIKQMTVPLHLLAADSVWAGWAGVDIHPLVELGVPGIGLRTHADDYFLYHHSPADTFDKIDPTDLARNVATMAVLLYALAEDPISLRESVASQ